MSAKAKVIVIDDDPIVRRSCERILGNEHEVRLAENGREGVSALEAEPFDLALVDLMLPDITGTDILREAPDKFPDVPIIIITGYSTIESAVEAIKMGAFDYLAKPFEPHGLEASVEKALRQRRLLTDYRELQDVLTDRYHVSRIIGESPAMKRVFSLVEQVAKTDSTVLITGESGTGKELIARAIHFSSPRKDARFVAVDCGAVAPNLIASELFGHVKGAFTGATQDHMGLVQVADRGTLFLDEISNLPLDLQAALLRVIQEQEVRPVGGAAPLAVDVRYVAATNCCLRELVDEGQFREDLLFRLNVFPIELPPLRERREDVPLLARHFLAIFSQKMHKRVDDFTEEAMDLLVQYDWLGNVRELSNVVERLVILCNEGRVGQAPVMESMPLPASAATVPQTARELNDLKEKAREQAVAEIEKNFLIEALRRNDYNVTRAAEQTGMQRPNFQALLKKHGLRLKDLAVRHQ